MSTITFDTLKLARKLEAAGFDHKQAADTAEALSESMAEVSGLATKQDITDLRRDIAEMELRLQHNLTVRLGAMIAFLAVVMAGLLKIVH